MTDRLATTTSSTEVVECVDQPTGDDDWTGGWCVDSKDSLVLKKSSFVEQTV